MSDNLDFYIQGRIEPGTPFHIVSKRTVQTNDPIFSTTSTQNSGDNYWSFMGVKEEYVNFYDVMTDPFYYYDSSSSKYYYPLYLCDRGSGNVTTGSQATGTAIVSGGVITKISPITAPGKGFSEGQEVTITSGTSSGKGTVSVNEQLGVSSVSITNGGSQFSAGEVTIKGLTSSVLITPAQALVAITSPSTPITFYGKSDTLTGQTDPPHPDLNLKSWDAIKNIPYVVYGTDSNTTTNYGLGYYYPLYLDYTGDSNGYTFTEIPDLTSDLTFKMPTGSSNHHAEPVSPNKDSAQCIFYNPYDSLMDSLFKYEPNEDGTIQIQLVSAGHYMESANDYQYMTYSGTENPTLSMSSNSSDIKSFILDPIGRNVNSSKIYSGVPYLLKLNENFDRLNYNFIGDITKDTGKTYLDKYFKDGYSGAPSTTNFIGNATTPNYITLTTVPQSFKTASNIELYFIPAKQSTFQLSTHKILTYLDYNAQDMLIMSPQVYNVKPKILISDSTSYYNWRTTTGESTQSNELAFSTQLSGAFTALSYNYCTGTNSCGKCFGKCDLSKVSNPTTQCVYDSLSVEKFNKGEDAFTCNHERYYEKSEHVSGVFIENHSNTAIIIVLVIGIILATGFILYEERNRISKEFFHLKNRS